MTAMRLSRIVGMAACLGGATCLTEVAHANLVTNGGFETGDFTGWTRAGNMDFTSVQPASAHTGSFGAELGPIGTPGFLRQTILTTPGQTYNVSLWLANGSSGAPNRFAASFGGSPILTPIVNGRAFPYTFFSANIVASGTGALLQMGGYQHDLDFFHLDNIDVSAVPLPATLPLLLSGVMGLGLLGWRKRQAAMDAC
jgi:hypothetical protein